MERYGVPAAITEFYLTNVTAYVIVENEVMLCDRSFDKCI